MIYAIKVPAGPVPKPYGTKLAVTAGEQYYSRHCLVVRALRHVDLRAVDQKSAATLRWPTCATEMNKIAQNAPI